jgi:hypothetical protein
MCLIKGFSFSALEFAVAATVADGSWIILNEKLTVNGLMT